MNILKGQKHNNILSSMVSMKYNQNRILNTITTLLLRQVPKEFTMKVTCSFGVCMDCSFASSELKSATEVGNTAFLVTFGNEFILLPP